VRALRGRDVIISFHIFPTGIVCLNGLDAPVGWSRSSQCLMSKIFEATYHHKLPFNSKDLVGSTTKSNMNMVFTTTLMTLGWIRTRPLSLSSLDPPHALLSVTRLGLGTRRHHHLSGAAA
jgi:hypothetical protein